MYELKGIVADEEGQARFLSAEEKESWGKFASELEEFIFFTRPSQEELENKKWDMRKLRKDFDLRYSEWRERDVLVEMIMKAFNDMQNQIAKIQKNNSDLPDSEVAETQMKIENAREWLNKAKAKLQEQELFEAPSVKKREMVDKKEEMDRLIYKLRNYKKPKEKKKDSKADDAMKTMREKLKDDLKLDPKFMEGMTDEQLKQLLESVMKTAGKKKEGEGEEDKKDETKAEDGDAKPDEEAKTEEEVEADDGTGQPEQTEESLNNVGDDIPKDL